MSVLTKNGKLLTADGSAIKQKSVTPLEVEELINKKIIDLGTFAFQGELEDGLKEFFTAAEAINLEYKDTRIFIGTIAGVKVMALGNANNGGLSVFTDNYRQYEVYYNDADLLDIKNMTPKIHNVGSFAFGSIETSVKQFALEVKRTHIHLLGYGRDTTCLYTGDVAGDIPVLTCYKGDEEMYVIGPNTTYKVTNLYNEENVEFTELTKADESLVIDMGNFDNRSTEEALKELFIAIENTGNRSSTNYIYTAEVNGFKVKGMFNDIQLILDTNVRQNDADVKYEISYDDDDNLSVYKYFVPTTSEYGSMMIHGESGSWCEIAPEDGYICLSHGGEPMTSISISPYDIDILIEGKYHHIEWSKLESQFFNFNEANVVKISAIDMQAPQYVVGNTVVQYVDDRYYDSDILELNVSNTNQIAIELVPWGPPLIFINFENALGNSGDVPTLINRTPFNITNLDLYGLSDGTIQFDTSTSIFERGTCNYLIITFEPSSRTIILDHAYWGEI